MYATMIFLASYEANHITLDEKLNRLEIFIFVFMLTLLIPYLMSIFLKKRYIKLTHKKAVYCTSDLTPYKAYSLAGKKEFVSAFYAVIGAKWLIYMYLAIFSLYFLSSFDIEIIICTFLMVLAVFTAILHDILLRMLFYITSNKRLKNFWKYHQKCVLDIGWERTPYVKKFAPTLYFFNQKDHDDLQEYFLATFGLDFDNDIKGVKLI